MKAIEHRGIVESTDDGVIKVNITAMSACASCQVKGSCSVGDMENKVVEIRNSNLNIRDGEFVNVVMSQSLGYKALFYGYILPFILIFVVLITATEAGLSEGYAGLLALSPLPVYYLILYLLKDRLRKTFSFSIHKLV